MTEEYRDTDRILRRVWWLGFIVGLGVGAIVAILIFTLP